MFVSPFNVALFYYALTGGAIAPPLSVTQGSARRGPSREMIAKLSADVIKPMENRSLGEVSTKGGLLVAEILDGLIRAVAIDSITRPLEFRPPEEAAAQGRGFGKTRSGAVPKKKPRIRIGALRLYPSGGGERYRVAPVRLQGPCQDGREASTLIFKGSQLKTPILAREMRQDCAPCTVTRSKNEQAKLSASARKIAGDA